MFAEQLRILVAVLLPIAVAILAYSKPQWRSRLVLGTTALVSALVISLYGASFSGQTVYRLTQIAAGLELAFHLDPLTWLFAFISSLLWVPASFYALGYMHGDAHEGRFFAYYLLSLSATMGVAFAGNLITLYLFYELLTLVTYPLVVHSGGPAAEQAGRNYITYSLFGAALILLGIVLVSSFSQSLTFTPGGMLTFGHSQLQIARILLLVLIFGFGTKAAITPLSRWLPLAMAAPTPVSALLHAVAVVNAGSYGIIRVVHTVFGRSLVTELGMQPLLVTIACVTIIYGSIRALREDAFKRRLAYSTVSQMGYLMLGGVLLSPLGLVASLLHFINHALLKISLFFSAGALFHSSGITKVSEMRGLGKRFPWIFATITLASLGMVGIVPMNGFVSKWYYLQGALEADSSVVVWVLGISSLLNALYYFPIVSLAFFSEQSDEQVVAVHHDRKLELPGFVIACCSLLLGIFPHWAISAVEKAVSLIS